MQLLHADAVRGMHGTGLFAADREGSSYRLRVGGPPYELVNSTEFTKFEKFVDKKFVRFLVGHNRYATRGFIQTQHSHPFRDGEILLVHNGTLDSFGHLPDAKKYDVDSEAICHAFSEWGVEKTVPTLKGAWTFVWWDGQSKTVNFLRNKERPLWMARHKKDKIIYFASESGMLSWVLGRNSYWDYDMEELPENKLYSYGLESAKPHVKEVLGKQVKEYKPYEDKGWEAWGAKMREEAGGSGKALPEAEAKIVQLPLLPRTTSHRNSTTGSGTTSGTTTNRGFLPQKANSNPAAGSFGDKGFWTAADAIHDIGKGQKIVVWPLEYKAIDTDKARADGLFQVKCLSDQYPDIDFFCNIRGKLELETIMEAPEGLRADVKSILRSMNTVAKHPHQIYLNNPEPMYIPEPPTIPKHAEVKTS